MKALVFSGLCMAALWGGVAGAQEDYPPPGMEVETVELDTRENRADTGIYALVGGGAEAYTGQLAPSVNPGLSYGATLGLRPSGYFGVELGYSGGLSDIDPGGDGGISDGADLIRNGGQAVVVGSFTDTRLQPYVLTGIGIETFNVRDDLRGETLGFSDDTSGYVPAGIGMRYQVGKLITADARANYNILFDQDFVPTTLDPGVGDGRVSFLLSLGGTY
ncbi:outer membrane beta-barrel protein [Pyxidicoccus trucidator]|uniref:outer membrane beta-barrel protein n=1 Tax=Pyxidicoccus trucidator TaxID=2709662 RepID=UPI0013D968B4|nr:outer membrane beta-barrel protein [Pyxidicoccus trucidator]